MSSLPKVGLYVSTQKVKGMRVYVESSYGDDPAEFYLVEVIGESSKNDPSAMGDEMDKEQWELLVNTYGLEYQA